MRNSEQFVRDFQTFWNAPSVEALSDLLTEDVTLIQPLAGRMRGLAEARREFARIFALIPDLQAQVDRWAGDEEALFIEFRLFGTLGGGRVEWHAVDRFFLRDGMATERVSYFDPSRLAGALASRPTSWPDFARSGIWRGWLGR